VILLLLASDLVETHALTTQAHSLSYLSGSITKAIRLVLFWLARNGTLGFYSTLSLREGRRFCLFQSNSSVAGFASSTTPRVPTLGLPVTRA
jgi:hypothetical protein